MVQVIHLVQMLYLKHLKLMRVCWFLVGSSGSICSSDSNGLNGPNESLFKIGSELYGSNGLNGSNESNSAIDLNQWFYGSSDSSGASGLYKN